MAMYLRKRQINFITLFNLRQYCCKSGEKPKNAKTKTASKEKVDTQKVIKVYRFAGSATGEKPKVQTYNLDVSTCPGPMVLDVLMKLKEMDPTLCFRRSCREGVCGSCSINLQGKNCLACIMPIPKAKKISIYPVPHMYVIRDLVVDMSHFFNGYDSIHPYLMRHYKDENYGKQQFAQSIDDNLLMNGLYECVLCGCCSTACVSYWWNGRRFLGPATLMHAYRWIIDSRDEATTKRLSELRDDFKLFRCHSIFLCSGACPKHLEPGEHVQKLKRLVAGLAKKPLPQIEPLKFLSKPESSNKSQC